MCGEGNRDYSTCRLAGFLCLGRVASVEDLQRAREIWIMKRSQHSYDNDNSNKDICREYR